MNLSIIIPVYNEVATILLVIERCNEVFSGIAEIIVVDDCSTDGTREALQANKALSGDKFVLICRSENGGKSAAVKDGLSAAIGEWIAIQDADLEYSPVDLKRIFRIAVQEGLPTYGKRPSCWRSPSRWLFASGVLFIDICLMFCYGHWLRDHASCYKIVRASTLQKLKLESTGFEGCIEITAKLFRLGVPIKQIPISYLPRKSNEGKKLKITYGLKALASVWKWRNWEYSESLPFQKLPEECL